MDDKAEILQAINQLGTAMGRELAELKAGISELRAGQIATNERLSRVEGRIEEQSHILAVLIPTKIAAVGGR